MSGSRNLSRDTLTRYSTSPWFRFLAAGGAVAALVSYLFHPQKYRVDLEVYRAGGQAFLHGVPLYAQAFPTRIGDPLDFTYPPIAAVLLSPLAWLSLDAASAVWAVLTLALLIGVLAIVVRVSGVPARTTAWWWLLTASFALTARLEPVRANLNYGQINVLLMALIVADCLLVRTPWPRGAVIGLVAAVKLTPAVFVIYFLVRRDYRAAFTAAVSAALVTGLGFALAPADSVEYWFHALTDTSRIGSLIYSSNQNLQGVIARAGVTGSAATGAWLVASALVLVLGVVAMRRAHRAGLDVLVLACNGLIGLLISPISWSHHWVWTVPTILALIAIWSARRSVTALVVAGFGLIMLAVAPQIRLPQDNSSGVELTWAVWQKVVGNAYVWWALVVLGVCALLAHRWGAVRPSEDPVRLRAPA